MALKFKKEMAHKSNYGGTRSESDIKYIVIHYTGNNGDTAANNCKYFQGANRNASAHYFVDGGAYIYNSVPVKSVAWSVGGFYSQSGGAGTYYQKCTNANSISIEMCNCVKSVPGDVFDQTVELTRNECRILQLLLEHKGEIVSRDALMTRLWESDSFVDENTLTVNIARLRRKLESAGLPDFIRTRKGAGYLVEG